MNLENSTAIVTGAASGLGAATAAALREGGAQVAILDRDADRGAAFAETIGASFFEVDVTDADSAAAAVAGARAAMGSIGICVNCAGIATAIRTLGRNGPHPLEPFRKTVDVNLVGSFNMARLAASAMADNPADADGQRGVIINTASVAAFEGQKGQAAYAASKAGIAGLSLPMARDLASLGIRVNAIAPGVFRTPMLEELGQEVMDGLARDITFPRRLGAPEEFAQTVCFMIACNYVNGTVLRLDGALRMP